MFCINCGTKLPDGAKFCFNCGARMPEMPNGTVPESAPAADKEAGAPAGSTASPECHIVVCVVTCHYHQVSEDDLLVSRLLYLLDHLRARRVSGFAFDSSYENIAVSQVLHLCLYRIGADCLRSIPDIWEFVRY